MELNPNSKSHLRRQFHVMRSRYLADHAEARTQLTAHLERWLRDFCTPQTQVALYRPLPHEAKFDLEPVTRFFYPRIVGSTLQFFRPLTEGAFDEHEYGMLEPIPAESEALVARNHTVVFCPALAVDGSGRRLGLGKGFYDRFFSEHPEATRVGVVYQVQVSSDPLPADSWDQTLDWIITDKMILRTAKRSA